MRHLAYRFIRFTDRFLLSESMWLRIYHGSQS
jgi:hypothetical protein